MAKNKPKGRAILVTTQEISMVFWIMSLLFGLIMIKLGMPMIYNLMLGLTLFFSFMAVVWPCYLISKYNLNMFIDRITNPDFENWLRYTKDRMFAPQIVRKGPLGQNKGIASGVKADIINRGDYQVTLLNGNRAIIKYDMMSRNINLDEAVGWQILKKRHGFVGYRAYEHAVAEGETLIKIEPPSKKEKGEGDHGRETKKV